MSDVLVVSGGGAYADPWHPLALTSRRIAEIIQSLGYDVAVRDDVEAALARPGSCRLLVVNIGNPGTPRPQPAVDAAAAGLIAHLGNGGSILGVHSSATSFTTMPQWSPMFGGRWIWGHSMHPPQGEAHIVVVGEHPITAGLADFTVHDERYSYLHTEPDVTVLCEHDHDGHRHPLVWARQTPTARVVYDGLGHDLSSYSSPGRVDLLRRSVRWLLRDLPEAPLAQPNGPLDRRAP